MTDVLKKNKNHKLSTILVHPGVDKNKNVKNYIYNIINRTNYSWIYK